MSNIYPSFPYPSPYEQYDSIFDQISPPDSDEMTHSPSSDISPLNLLTPSATEPFDPSFILGLPFLELHPPQNSFVIPNGNISKSEEILTPPNQIDEGLPAKRVKREPVKCSHRATKKATKVVDKELQKQKIERRIQLNREYAQASRDRQKAYVRNLENLVALQDRLITISMPQGDNQEVTKLQAEIATVRDLAASLKR